MRDRVAAKLERRQDGIAGMDPHLFPAEEKEDRPEEIDELHREEPLAERDARRGALARNPTP
jgi:hypothetical protein